MDRYSRMIVWLKVLLPLMALALLSTLFLLSRNVDPLASIPFAQAEIDERLKEKKKKKQDEEQDKGLGQDPKTKK